MAERSSVRSSVRARSVSGYQERLRQLTEAFNLPDDVRVWATARLDRDSEDESLRYRVTLHAQAGQTVTSIEVGGGDTLRQTLLALLDENREDLEAQLKTDLAVNLMAGINEGPARGEE